MAPCLDCSLLGMGGSGGVKTVVTDFLVSHSQLWVFSHGVHWKRSFPALYSQQNHGSLAPRGLHCYHGPWTSTRPLVVTHTTDIKMLSSGSTDHRHQEHQHGLRLQHRPLTSTWFQAFHIIFLLKCYFCVYVWVFCLYVFAGKPCVCQPRRGYQILSNLRNRWLWATW